MTKLLKITIFIVSLLLTTSVLSHSKANTSVPAEGDLLTESPAELILTVSGKSRIINLVITDANGEEVDIDFKPIMKPAKKFIVSIPTLLDGSYTMVWTIMGKDTHKVLHEVNFSLSTTPQ